MSRIELLHPDWDVAANVRAAFTLRAGGESAPPFDSLNLGAHCGDVSAAVQENQRRLREALSLPSEPAWMEQVHGTDVANLDDPAIAAALHVDSAERLSASALRESAPANTETPTPHLRADAAVAHAKQRVCVVRVADCMPVLFAAVNGEAVGAAHAGWRGLCAGVLETTVAAMGVQPSELAAWMGPAIGPAHFEVGEEVRAAFLAHDARAEAAFAANARGRWLCDLYALARQRLEALGVREIKGGGWCTYADATRFYSYRRDGRTGRMAALVWRD